MWNEHFPEDRWEYLVDKKSDMYPVLRPVVRLFCYFRKLTYGTDYRSNEYVYGMYYTGAGCWSVILATRDETYGNWRR